MTKTPQTSKVWRGLRWLCHGTFALLFLLSALAQLNDPDPLIWTLAYGAAALVALSAALRAPGLTEISAALALIYLCWAAWLARNGMPPISTEALFGDITMKTDAVELWRETLGLAILGFYLTGTAIWSRFTRP